MSFEPKELKELITETKVEVRNGIKYTTHFVNRPIKQGDLLDADIGVTVNGVEIVTERIEYIYKTTEEKSNGCTRHKKNDY